MPRKLAVFGTKDNSYYMLNEKEAIGVLKNDPKNYQVVDDKPYLLRNKNTGDFEEVEGRDVTRMLGEGYNFSTEEDREASQIAKEVRAEQGFGGDVIDLLRGGAKGFFMGFDPVKPFIRPKTALGRELEREREKSGYTTAGNILGTLLGFGKIKTAGKLVSMSTRAGARMLKGVPGGKAVGGLIGGASAYSSIYGATDLAQNVTEGLQKKYVDEEDTELSTIMKKASSDTLKGVGETMIGTTVGMGVLGPVGKGVGAVAKLPIKAVGLTKHIPSWLRNIFFKTKEGNKEYTKIKHSLGLKETSKPNEVLKKQKIG